MNLRIRSLTSDILYLDLLYTLWHTSEGVLSIWKDRGQTEKELTEALEADSNIVWYEILDPSDPIPVPSGDLRFRCLLCGGSGELHSNTPFKALCQTCKGNGPILLPTGLCEHGSRITECQNCLIQQWLTFASYLQQMQRGFAHAVPALGQELYLLLLPFNRLQGK